MTINRRQFVGTGAAATMVGLPGLPAFAQSREIRHFWWGNPERDRRTFEVIDLFQAANPEIAVSGETIGWGDYWTKMATQTAGGNMADLVQMDYGFLFEYVRRGALQPLDPHVGQGLDLSEFDESALAGGRVDGELYALNIGSNTQAFPYNTQVMEENGIAFDPIAWTWEDFARVCAEVTEATGGAVRGSDDFSTFIELFDVWSRQMGRDLYAEDGTLALTAEDLAAFWSFWKGLREAGHVSGPDRTVVLDAPMTESGIVVGDAAISFFWSNQLVGLQSLTESPLGVAAIPTRDGGEPGQYIKPSMFLALTRDAGDVEAAVAYMNAWVNDPEAVSVLGLERGIPASAGARELLAPSFSEIEAATVSYFNAVAQQQAGPLPLPSPKGAGEVRNLFQRTATEVVLDDLTPEEGAARFVDEAAFILERAE